MSAINKQNASDILSDLLSKLSDPPWGFQYTGYHRYQGLFNSNGSFRRSHRPGRDAAAIRDLLSSGMRDEVFEIFGEPSMNPRNEMEVLNRSFLTIFEGANIRAKAGDISKTQRGVYLHIIEGTDNRLRLFVGQSDNMSFRIRRQHQNFRYRRDNPSYHTYAMQNSRWDYFIILAVLPPGLGSAGFTQHEQGLQLNILCMRCTLLFCTLQPSTMAEWQGERKNRSPWTGLNLACPLDHGVPGQYVNWRHALSESEDLLARSYVVEVLDSKRAVTPPRAVFISLGIVIFVTVWISSLCRVIARRSGKRKSVVEPEG